MTTLEEMAREAGFQMKGSIFTTLAADTMMRWEGEPLALERFAALVRAQDARHIEVLQHEHDRARAQFENAVRLLTGIHNLLYPAPIKMEDGRTMVFRPENPHEFMQALSDRIRALPDELAALKDRP